MLTSQLINEINNLKTFEECKEAWNLIKFRHETLVRGQASTFRVGQSVWFMSKKAGGQRIEGTVIRINRKSISVSTPMGKWNVAPSLLQPVESKASKA